MPPLGLKKKPAKTRSKPATASAKRHKSGLRSTPFTSLMTGKPFLYDDSTSDDMNYITCTPIQQGNHAPAMPISAVEYIKNAVSAFAAQFHDLLDAGDFWIVIYQLDLDKYDTLSNFLKPGLVTIPRTKVTVHFASDWIENLIMEAIEDNEMPSESECVSSSSEEEQHSQVPPWQRKSSSRATVTEIPDCKQAVASTSQSALPATREVKQPKKVSLKSTPAPVARVELRDSEQIPPSPTVIPATLLLTQSSSQQSNQPVTPVTARTEDQAMEADTPVPSVKPPRRPDMPRRVRPVYRSIDFKKLEVEVPKTSFVTVLFRPTEPGATLHKANPFTVNDALVALGAEVQRRRCIRDGGLALDFLPEANLDPLLTVTTLANIPVTAHLPATKASAQGVICGVHWEISEEQIKKELRTEPQTAILEVKRLAKPGQQSWTVKVTFAIDQTPSRAFLAGQSHRIRPYENRPLQCFRCGVFGHAARVCRSKEHCWTCSGDHSATECPNKAEPKCRNCGGPHPADSTICPSRLFQLKVAEVKAKEGVPFKTARSAVTKAVRSYASALKGASSAAPVQTPTHAVPKVTKPCFKASTPHHRPPTEPQGANIFKGLFTSLISILSNAIATNNFSGALPAIQNLFKTSCPGEDDAFSLPA